MNGESTRALEGAATAGGERTDVDRARAAFIGWVALVAPGIALSASLALLALIVAPALTPFVYVEAVVRRGAALLLAMHLASSVWIVRVPGRWSTLCFCALLLIDAGLSGVLVGAPWQVSGAAVALVVISLAPGLVLAGWPGALSAGAAVGLGVAIAVWYGVGTPLIFSPTPVAASALSIETRFAGTTVTAPPATLLLVEPYFAGVLAVAQPDYSFATELIVEPYFAGIPGMGSAAALLPAALSAALLALCSGSALCLLRLRGARQRADLDRPA